MTRTKEDKKIALLLILFAVLFLLTVGFSSYLTRPLVVVGKPAIGMAAVETAIFSVGTTSVDVEQAPAEPIVATNEYVQARRRTPHVVNTAPTEPAPPVIFILFKYVAGSNGSLTGSTTQTVVYGGGGTTVTALPNVHYHFVNWSDGSMTNPRTDTAVTAAMIVSANFAIDTYTLTYTAGNNGFLVGSTTQTIAYGDSGTSVTPAPRTDYFFTNWSDGSTANPRIDNTVSANMAVTARFAYGNGNSGSSPTPVTVSGGAPPPPPPLI